MPDQEKIAAFRRLLNPIWMQLVYNALGNQPEPTDDDILFTFMGGGGSDFTTYGQFKELMGDPWKAVRDMDGDSND